MDYYKLLSTLWLILLTLTTRIHLCSIIVTDHIVVQISKYKHMLDQSRSWLLLSHP